jgi:hypothetical protein
MTAPEAYIRYSPEVFTADGEVVDEAMAAFLRNFMAEFRTHLARVLTVIPATAVKAAHFPSQETAGQIALLIDSALQLPRTFLDLTTQDLTLSADGRAPADHSARRGSTSRRSQQGCPSKSMRAVSRTAASRTGWEHR